jgi:uncharacterized membrane protein
MVWILGLLIGVVCGLRSMTAPALVCWAAHLNLLDLTGSPLAFMASPIALWIFTLAAIGELIADKLPKVPRRTSAGPLIVRIILGGICGGALAIGGHAPMAAGIILGGLGAVLGAFAGYAWRRMTSGSGRIPDLPVALLEDLVAIAGGIFLISRF